MLEIKNNQTVRLLNDKYHKDSPDWFPPSGAIGEVVGTEGELIAIRWKSDKYKEVCCYISAHDVEVADI